MGTLQIAPLDDAFVTKFCFSRFSFYYRELKKQLLKRPNVWGVGLWPDEETESIAKKVAERISESACTELKAFIPQDKLSTIELLDYEWGAVTHALPSINYEFDCSLDVDKLTAQNVETFGDLVEVVKSRRGEGQKMPEGKR